MSKWIWPGFKAIVDVFRAPVGRKGPNLMQGRYVLSDGRYADHNGTIEEKFLYYFMAFTSSEKSARQVLLENASLSDQLRDIKQGKVA